MHRGKGKEPEDTGQWRRGEQASGRVVPEHLLEQQSQ